ncbi:MAG: hypothetical protein E7271_11375 [Lachnospiraceae bacterium]|nr:hypothetical protein [Lachnospiraceae bacterium]
MKKYSLVTELKNLIKLFKYTRQWKVNMVAGIMYLLLGVFMIFTGGYGPFIGGMWLVTFPSITFSGLEQVYYSSYMNSSPKHKYYSLVLHPVLIGMMYLTGYIIAALTYAVKVIIIRTFDGFVVDIIMDMNISFGIFFVFIGLLGMLFYIYSSISSKANVWFMIVFIVAFILIYMGTILALTYDEVKNMQLDFPVGVGFVIGLLLIILGIVVGTILRYALYKKPYSPMIKKVFVKLEK